jgi:predicted O-methyltransferase YrrM
VTYEGTARYDGWTEADGVPPLVLRAVELARSIGFPLCVHPGTGRMLAALAGGVVDGVIGETGTGTGVGVAWMLSTMPSSSRVITIELDEERATAAADLFVDHPGVTVLHGEANELAAHAPFDLLVLDTKCDEGPLHRATLDPRSLLSPGGVVVKDDLWPMDSWPPLDYEGEVDDLRVRFFEHPDLLTTEVDVADGFAVQIGRLRPL